MPVLITAKKPLWIQEHAKAMSDWLGKRRIKNQPDWPRTRRLMELNHEFMQLFGWFKDGEGFRLFHYRCRLCGEIREVGTDCYCEDR